MISCLNYFHTIYLGLLWIQSISCMSMLNKHSYFMDSNSDINNNDVVDMIASKGYLPDEKYLPKTSFVKSSDNEVTYLLSKLSDDELIKLLNEQPKKNEYDLKDIVKLAFDSKFVKDNKLNVDNTPREVNNDFDTQNSVKKRFRTVPEKNKSQIAFFKLDNKQVYPYSFKADADPNYVAIQKLSNILYSRPIETDKDEKTTEDEEKKELLFDVLVSQLKTLCCKKTRHINKVTKYQPVNDFVPANAGHNVNALDSKTERNEHMFLIINDEIKSNGSDELISVDPDSLERNSSVLLLGPINTPLTNSQLKLVMYRISNELSKPEYIPLLQQLSEGNLTGNNIKLMKSLVTGPETRRYIKPHRCNHQSKLARIYGGPKWLICTGYLNLNTPSYYD
ncbi:uncharacterized protein LOC114359160 isoform X1 [Ostrinia furnacalis]|uniref:uncharacterized protein LOC114359160 isoform X1 n=2 Tax=Ostrinia furnacalis TaxID=93504 RepID=UPI00103C212D|nr:uncharacterized protein LOC114359160 isoform X1 [Ostrinia furnacalis]